MTIEVRTYTGRIIEVHFNIEPRNIEQLKIKLRSEYPYPIYFTEHHEN